MKAITKFQALDGTEFSDKDKCCNYELLCEEIAKLMEPWPEVNVKGTGFVQADKATVLRIQRSMVAIFERDHWKDRHTRWAAEADVPAGMTLIGRYVDDAGVGPERRVWGRLALLDKMFRQYEQPYYAIQADKAMDDKEGKTL